MSGANYLYVDPLGGHKDISYNNVDILKKSTRTLDARVEDSKLQNQSHYLQLSVWSVTAGISIIALLILLRGVNS
mgnify:CR=1 FL=1|tara:strand:+ start:1251 stop:1475 length:225 start_codon:yes stop_codon:yes gene_type:complete